MNLNEYEQINIRAMKSFDGIALSFDSKNYYHLYYLYIDNGNGFEYVGSSKSVIFKSEKIKEGCKYYVDGYREENGKYILKGKSEICECSLINREKSINPLISIVCPVYNSSSTISNCIDSILLSTQKDLEIIIVDDGSTDNSKSIIEWYMKEYDGIIKYYYQENQGVSFARNEGIKHVTGEYTSFVDSDDCVHPRMFEELLNACVKNNTPIAISKTILIDKDENIKIVLDIPNKNNKESIVLTYDEMMNSKEKNDSPNIYFVAVWNKIIKSDLVKKHLFPPFNHYEDIAYTRTIYSYCDKFSFVFDAYYIWDQRKRKTEGTESTRNYVTETSESKNELNKKYFNAILFGYEYGNIDKKDYLSYDVIRDIFSYLKEKHIIDNNNQIYIIAKELIKKYFTKSYLLSNFYIINNQEVFNFIKEMEDL